MGLWDRDWYVDEQMKRLGMGGKPPPSRFSPKGAPPDVGARPSVDSRPLPRFRGDRPVAWASLIFFIFLAAFVAVAVFKFALKRWA